MKQLSLFMIDHYRKSGGGKRWFQVECNFEPTCSKYTYDAIEHLGFYHGIKAGFKRIKSCTKSDALCKCIDPFVKG